MSSNSADQDSNENVPKVDDRNFANFRKKKITAMYEQVSQERALKNIFVINETRYRAHCLLKNDFYFQKFALGYSPLVSKKSSNENTVSI